MLTVKQMREVEQAWAQRARFQGYKPMSATYMKAQAEFFAGAMAASNELPAFWSMSIMGGRDIVAERAKYDKRDADRENMKAKGML